MGRNIIKKKSCQGAEDEWTGYCFTTKTFIFITIQMMYKILFFLIFCSFAPWLFLGLNLLNANKSFEMLYCWRHVIFLSVFLGICFCRLSFWWIYYSESRGTQVNEKFTKASAALYENCFMSRLILGYFLNFLGLKMNIKKSQLASPLKVLIKDLSNIRI